VTYEERKRGVKVGQSVTCTNYEGYGVTLNIIVSNTLFVPNPNKIVVFMHRVLLLSYYEDALVFIFIIKLKTS